MKRDPDIIRTIALAVEELPPGGNLQALEGIEPDAFAAHTQWMSDAGLIEANIMPIFGGQTIAMINRLTWDGCDFLDAARSDTLWKKAKTSIIAPTASWTFDILKEWLKSEIRNGLPTLRDLAR